MIMLVFHIHNKHGHERLILNRVEILCKVKGGGGGGGVNMRHVWFQDRTCKKLEKLG